MGSDMRELIDAEQVSRAFNVLALVLPPIGLLVGWWYGGRRGAHRRGAILGLMSGLLGPLNCALWRVYNAITDSIGLDTVRNLAINLVLFLVVGAVIGVGTGVALRSVDAMSEGPRPTDEAE